MINIPTVLVLGAGASAHCSYPLGRELVAELARLRGDRSLDGLPEGWTRPLVDQFLTKLTRSDPASIDAFLETNPDSAPLGKYLIARQLKQREELDRLFLPHDSGWYRHVFDRLLANGEPQFDRSKLKVVTFNYDRSLEAYFLARLQAAFDLTESDAAAALGELPIVHVHGILGELATHPYSASTTPEDLLAISRRIQIIHEIRDEADRFCNKMFERAHEWLVQAERIYFLGFGFHRDNIRRFRFFSPAATAGKLIRATATGYGSFDMKALRESLRECGFPQDAFDGHVCNAFFSHVGSLE